MNVTQYFIERPVAVSLLMAGILFAGVASYAKLPVSGMPEVDIPTLIVTAELSGASADTVATTIAAPLERALGKVAGVESMSSTSALGVTDIVLQFDAGKNIDAAAFDVQSAIDSAANELPKNLLHPPAIIKNAGSDSKLLTIAASSDAMPVEQVSTHVEEYLMPRLQQIPGVGKVYFHGLRKPAVRVRINPHALSALGLSLEDVRLAIANATARSPKGEIAGTRQAFSLETTDQLVDAAQYGAIVIAQHASSRVLLRDVASVTDSAENTRTSAWVDGARAVTLEISKAPGFNVVETAERVTAALPELAKGLPASVKLTLSNQRTRTIRASLHEFQFTLLLTVGLVVLVVFLFLGNWRATIIPSIAIPLSLLATFVVVHQLGFTLNNVSLMALSIVIGFVVDDAVVMLENILRYIEEGDTPYQAALKGGREITFTIVSMTISLVAAFIPILFMDGLVGRIFWEFAVTASVAILFSGLVSLAITPMLCSRFLSRKSLHKDGGMARLSDRALQGLVGRYAVTLQWALRHPRIVLASLLLAMAGTWALYQAIPKGFFPKQDSGILFGVVEGPLDISFDAMRGRMDEVATVLRKDPALAHVAYYVEEGLGANVGRLVMELKPRAERGMSIYDVVKRLNKSMKAFPGVAVYLQPRQDVQLEARISKAEYEYTLKNADVAELAKWAAILHAEMGKMPMIANLHSDLAPFTPQFKLELDRDAMARLGITPRAVNDILHSAFGQRRVASFTTQTNLHHVIMELDPAYQLGEEALSYIYVPSATTRQLVPLRSFTTLHSVPAPQSINHQWQSPAVTFSFNIKPGYSLSDAVAAIAQKQAELRTPPGLSGEFKGTALAFKKSLASQPLLIMAAILAIYIILGMLYESYIHPLTILSTLPSASLGALAALVAWKYEFTLIAFIGILLLIGIVKKNGIMLVDFAVRAEAQGKCTPHDAIYQACLLRFRPILMTTVAALLGAFPLLLGHGEGAELRHPLGVTLLAGLLVSQLMTLYTTPVIYLYLSRAGAWMRRMSGGSQPAGVNACSPV